MRSNNTFGVHFITRQNQKGNCTIFARIVVNKTRSELGQQYCLPGFGAVVGDRQNQFDVRPQSTHIRYLYCKHSV